MDHSAVKTSQQAENIEQWHHLDGLVQERRNSIANALELRLSCTNPPIPLSGPDHYKVVTRASQIPGI